MIRALRQRLSWDPYTRGALAAVIVGAFVACSQAATFLSKEWRVAYDKAEVPCLPYRLYLVRFESFIPDRGQIVSFRTRDLEPITPNGTVFTKQVIGLPGDTVAVDAAGASVAGQRLLFTPRALRRLKTTGAALARTYRLGPGEYFMAGTTSSAFDSRYYGPVHASQLIGSARPLW